jgi:Ca2+-binding RTX toxin-like protein
MCVVVQFLESRRLLAASLSAGVLTVTGTNSADIIELDLRDNGQLKVEINDVEQNFSYSAVNRIVINAQKGADTVEFNQRNPILKGSRVNAGPGNDTVEGTAGRDTIYGSSGHDVLDGRAGSDIIYGEAGRDVIEGKNGNDKLFGGSGADRIGGGNGIDTIVGGGDVDDLEGNAGTDSITGGAGNDDFDNSDSAGEIVDQLAEDNGPNALPNV